MPLLACAVNNLDRRPNPYRCVMLQDLTKNSNPGSRLPACHIITCFHSAVAASGLEHHQEGPSLSVQEGELSPAVLGTLLSCQAWVCY